MGASLLCMYNHTCAGNWKSILDWNSDTGVEKNQKGGSCKTILIPNTTVIWNSGKVDVFKIVSWNMHGNYRERKSQNILTVSQYLNLQLLGIWLWLYFPGWWDLVSAPQGSVKTKLFYAGQKLTFLVLMLNLGKIVSNPWEQSTHVTFQENLETFSQSDSRTVRTLVWVNICSKKGGMLRG